jgi:hypothetical protein
LKANGVCEIVRGQPAYKPKLKKGHSSTLESKV